MDFTLGSTGDGAPDTANPPCGDYEDVTVVVPAMDLTALEEEFHARVHSSIPGATVLYAINGPDARNLERAAAPEGCRLMATRPRFNHGVLDGLHAALASGSRRIVRMDSAEHPAEVLPDVLTRLSDDSMRVIDLSFLQDVTLRSGSADSYHNLYVIPEVLAALAGEGLRVSGTHGFMVMPAPVLALVLPLVDAALALVEAEGRQVIWGADTMLAVCAAKVGFEVCIEKVPAEEMRDRDEAKCAAQLRDTLALVKSVGRLHLEDLQLAGS